VKVGDLVGYTPDGVTIPAWSHWRGIIIKTIPGTAKVKMVMWSKDNNVVTSTKEKDLELISESR
jgi:hypothetical protein